MSSSTPLSSLTSVLPTLPPYTDYPLFLTSVLYQYMTSFNLVALLLTIFTVLVITTLSLHLAFLCGFIFCFRNPSASSQTSHLDLIALPRLRSLSCFKMSLSLSPTKSQAIPPLQSLPSPLFPPLGPSFVLFSHWMSLWRSRSRSSCSLWLPSLLWGIL